MARRKRGRGRPPVHRRRASKALEARVRRVGPDRFGVVAVDCAKRRFAVLLTDFYGHPLADGLEVENTAPALEGLVAWLEAQCERHGLKDLVVAVEQTGRYHRPVCQVLRRHWEVRMVHPFATKQLRQPADPGNKTDWTDLAAIVRAVLVGYATEADELPERWVAWRLVSRERENRVSHRARTRVRVQGRLEALLPGYPALFGDLWSSPTALFLAEHYGSARALLAADLDGLIERLHEAGRPARRGLLARVVQWARTAAPADAAAALRHRLLGDQFAFLRHVDAQIEAYERDLAAYLVQTPFVLLMSIPGVNVVSAASYAAELGPIEHYPHPKQISGRAGLYPSRYQSDQTDRADGPLVGHRNARLRDALMEIAHNLLRSNEHFKAWGQVRRSRGWSAKKVHVAVANKFARISYSMVAGRAVFRHPAIAGRDTILPKLVRFARKVHLPPQAVHPLLLGAARQLPAPHLDEEARHLRDLLPRRPTRRAARGPMPLGEVLRQVIAQLAAGLPLDDERRPTRTRHNRRTPG